MKGEKLPGKILGISLFVWDFFPGKSGMKHMTLFKLLTTN